MLNIKFIFHVTVSEALSRTVGFSEQDQGLARNREPFFVATLLARVRAERARLDILLKSRALTPTASCRATLREYEFVEVDEIILGGGSAAILPVNRLKIAVAVEIIETNQFPATLRRRKGHVEITE